MINWDEIKYSSEKARVSFIGLKVENMGNIMTLKKYVPLRKALISDRDKVFDKYDFDKTEKLSYKFDLTFALELYETLNEQFSFTLRDASNNDIWRFLQLEIIPDVVFSRWDLNEKRFYQQSRRIWLKTLWWYIHLSWMGSKEETYRLLQHNTTDTIMQLVERPGVGYNIKLYRELMRQYKNIDDGTSHSRMIFRRVLILNNARLSVITPELYEGGIKNYVTDLYRDVSKE